MDVNFYFYNNAIGTTNFIIVEMTDCDYYNIIFTLTSLYYTPIIIYYLNNCELCNFWGKCTNGV